MTIKVAKTPDGIVVRRITVSSEMAYRKHADGSWALCSGHKGPWVSVAAMDVPAYATAAIENERLRSALEEIAGGGWVDSRGRRCDYCHPEGCESPGIARKALEQ